MLPKTTRTLRIVAIVWLLLMGLNAVAAGYSFMVEPSGADIGIPLSYLQYSPFENYFIPGLVLFVTIGLGCLVAAFFAIKKFAFYPHLLFFQGCILLGWIVIQMVMVRDVAWLHVVCGLSGLSWMWMGILLVKEKRDVWQNVKSKAKGKRDVCLLR